MGNGEGANAEAMVCGIRIGQRVRATNDLALGTIRWLGTLPPAGSHPQAHAAAANEMYAGVEWDDPMRGKHDGVAFGQRLFHCCNAAAEATGRGASFVRVSALRLCIAFIEAFDERYGDPTSRLASSSEGLNVKTSRGSERGVEVKAPAAGTAAAADVLPSKHSAALSEHSATGPRGVYLPNALIGHSGSEERISKHCSNTTELDISWNPVGDSSWSEVSKICENMPRLQSLNASGIFPPTSCAPPSACFACVTQLALNTLPEGTASWHMLAQLVTSMPSLTKLHARDNGLGQPPQEGESDLEPLHRLEVLDLEGNNLHEWNDCVERLGCLRSLKRLHLGRNSLNAIGPSYRPAHDKGILFEALQSLLLGSNNISTWADVDALNTFPALRELRLSNNLVASKANERYEVIARVSGLVALNGSQVTEKERLDAELRYLRQLLSDHPPPSSLQPIQPPEEALPAHPRYKELLDKFGERALAGTHRTDSNTASSKISLTIKCVAPSAGERAEARKPLPPSTSVGNVKLLSASLFGLRSDNLRVFLHSEDMPVPDPLDDDEMRLDTCAVDESTTLLIDET